MAEVKLEAFLDIEKSLANRLGNAWEAKVGPVVREVAELVDQGDFDGAAQKIDRDLVWDDILEDNARFIDLMVAEALAFGVAKDGDTDDIDFSIFDPRVIEQQRALLGRALGQDTMDALQKSLHELIRLERRRLLEKSDYVFKSELFEDAAAATATSVGRDKALINASLSNSRTASYGFLKHTQLVRKVDRYEVNEQLDNRICPVCEMMHGKTFSVENALTRYEEAVLTDDPEVLKTTMPWPGQSEAALQELAAMDEETLTSRGFVGPPFHPLPVSRDTEFLAATGWKLVKDAAPGEHAYALDPATGEPGWARINKVVEGPAPHGRMVHFKSQNADLLVTEHHRQVYSARQRDGSYRYKVKPAGQLALMGRVMIPRTATWVGTAPSKRFSLQGRMVDTKALVRVLAWWISDGCCQKRSADSYQITISTRKYADLAIQGLEKLTGKPAGRSGGNVRCWDTALGRYLLEEVGSGANGKRIPNWIREADPETIRLFLENYLVADGSTVMAHGQYGDREVKTFFTSSELLAGQLGELIVKAGGYPRYDLQHNSGQMVGDRKIESQRPIHRIRWNTSKTATFGPNGKGTMEWVPYEGTTYCLMLDTHHVFYARRNGCCMWTGNCRGVLTVASSETVVDNRSASEVFNGKSEADLDEAWEKAEFGVSPQELKNAILPDGEFFDARVSASGKWVFKGKRGSAVKEIKRTIEKFRGELLVEHDLLELSKAAQGKGVGRRMLAEQFKVYKKMGVTKVTLLANIDVGGYAWARFGFKPANFVAADQIRDFVRERVEDLFRLGEIDDAMLKGVTAILDSNDEMFLTRIAGIERRTKGRRKKIGKELLLGQDWRGLFDMNDPKQLQALTDYLGISL